MSGLGWGIHQSGVTPASLRQSVQLVSSTRYFDDIFNESLIFPSPDDFDVGGNFLLYLCAMKSRFMRICCIKDKLYLLMIFSLWLKRQVTKQYGLSSKLYLLWWRKRMRKKKRQRRRRGEVATVLMVVRKITYLFNWFLIYNFYKYIEVCCSQVITLYSKLFTTFLHFFN